MKNISQLLFCALITTINLSASEHDDCNSLENAISRGYLPDVKKILDKKSFYLNHLSSHNGFTYLHRAASVGCTKIVQELIKHGAHVNAHYSNGKTPLHYAAAECHLNAAKALLEAGADKNAKDFCDRTPADLALKNRDHKGNHHQDVADFINNWQNLPKINAPDVD
jgi:ankyrin repeat protein